jgi:DNA-binding transcriptional LysR family regulator
MPPPCVARDQKSNSWIESQLESLLMELRQLEYFVAVAEEANFTRAAERVHISQSGVSAQIRQLERELGVILLDRSARAVRLTDAGAAVLDHARATLVAADEVRHAADDVNDLLRGRLVVGMVVACMVTPLFDALAAFHQAHPGVSITLGEANSDELVRQVRDGRSDLALIGCAQSRPDGLEGTTVFSERIVAMVASGHPLARRRRASLEAVLAHPVICLPAGTGIRAVFDQACAERGLDPRIALEATAPAAVADLAARGLGVAILSETIAGGLSAAGLVTVRLDVDRPALLALVHRPAPGPALRELLRHCEQAFGPGPT